MLGYKTYKGKTLAEAVAKMKMELGTNAMMLHHREIRSKGIMGFFRPPEFEVVGMVSDKSSIKNNILFKSLNNGSLKDVPKEDPGTLLQRELEDIKKQIKILTENKKGITVKSGEDSEKFKGFQRFVNIMRDNDIGDDLIESIMESIEKEIDVTIIDDERVIKEKIKQKLTDLFDTTGPIEINGKTPRIFMLIGPTGMGKTTSLVKIAANYRLKKNKQVEIISIDNYRIGASEQLKAYSEIMQVSFVKAGSKAELKTIIKKSKSDLILIDTAGRSPQDDISISMLRDYIKELSMHKPDIFLVISANVKKRDIIEIMNKYLKTNYKYLLYTKLDETLSTGAILDSTHRIKKPISFITTGQDVPKHIDIATHDYIVKNALMEL
ncbi:MAG: hypothetical protein JW827_10970 [Spirochaetes bacterium]|nr:hypothetical protein [Spirochaetota bacterium]